MNDFPMDPDWLPFDPAPSVPEFKLPAGAVDAHCHVFGPGDTFPYAPGRKYTPCDAPWEKLSELRDFLGVARAIVAPRSQASFGQRGEFLVNSRFVQTLKRFL